MTTYRFRLEDTGEDIEIEAETLAEALEKRFNEYGTRPWTYHYSKELI